LREDAMGFVAFGGFLIKKKVDEETLRKVADLLGVPKKEFDKDITSVFIYRGKARPPDAKKKPP
jgi:hypothetical protein